MKLNRLIFNLIIISTLLTSYLAGTSFSPGTNVSSGLPALNTYPDMAVGDNGEIYIVWVNTSQGGDVYFTTSDDYGATFTDPVIVNQVLDHTTTIGYSGPQIEVWQGTIHVLWTDQRNGYSHTTAYYARSLDGGITWEELRIGHENGINFYPELFVDDTGTIHASFHQFESRSFMYEHIVHRFSDDGGETWSDFYTVSNYNSGEPCDCCPIELHQLPNGNVITAFRNNESNIRDIYSFDWNPDVRVWENMQRITDDEFEINYCPSSGPRVAGKDSTIAVIYMSDIIGENRVYINLSNTLGNSYDWVIPVTDSSITNVYQNHPSITVTPDSTFHFLWEDTRNSHSIYYGSLTAGDTSVSNVFVLSGNNTNSPELAPVIQSDSLGNLFAIWVDRQAGRHINFATTYTSELSLDHSMMPTAIELNPPFPNPFNPSTTL